MPATVTYLNSREGAIPYERTNDSGDLQTARKYDAQLQIFIEGTVQECINYIQQQITYPVGEPFSFAGTQPLGQVPITESVVFDPDIHLKYPPALKSQILVTFSEVVWNYDKVASYGKMSGTITFEFNAPVEIYNVDTGNWDVTSPAEYS